MKEHEEQLKNLFKEYLDNKETLANRMHIAWSGWMKYLFSKAIEGPSGSIIIPVEFVERWKRQMNTLYEDLSPEEKESDRIEADKILMLLDMYPELF